MSIHCTFPTFCRLLPFTLDTSGAKNWLCGKRSKGATIASGIAVEELTIIPIVATGVKTVYDCTN
jgi:hypothetical protein